jgi:hypothetical protein
MEGSTGRTRFLVALETRMTAPDSSVTAIFTPLSMEVTLAEAITESAWNAAVLLREVPAFQVTGNPPPGTPPPPTNYVWCFDSAAYLQCIDDSECDETHADCVAMYDDIHAACVAAADLVYDCCTGTCICTGTPGLLCSALCYACTVPHGIEMAACWAARIGGLAGCDLAKTACYAGCYAGSWIQYASPPGCP